MHGHFNIIILLPRCDNVEVNTRQAAINNLAMNNKLDYVVMRGFTTTIMCMELL